jgi:hypothetical protein
MYNTKKYNSAMFGGGVSTENDPPAEDFRFNLFGLQNDNVVVVDSDFPSGPQIDIKSSPVPRNRGKILNDAQETESKIKMVGYLKHDTAAELEQLIDTMKKQLAAREGNIDILRPGWSGYRRWIGTLSNPHKMFSRREGYDITKSPFELEFKCFDPYAYDIDYSAEFVSGIAAATYNKVVTTGGTAQSRLILYVTFNSVTAGTDFTVTNNANGQQIKITPASIVAGDVFKIDAENAQVFKNSVPISYEGYPLDLEPGENNLQLDISSTNHDVEVTYKYKNAYR